MALRRHISTRSISSIRQISSIVDASEITKPASELLKTLNTYKETVAPNEAQLDYAYHYFTTQVPQFLFGTSKFREFPASSSPEVTFLGRSNVGKSSLLNALFNRPNDQLAFVSKRPGRTRAMNAFGIGGASVGGARRYAKPGMSLEMMADEDLKKGSEMRNYIGRGGIVVVDPPGYGHGSREEWGKEVVKYLQRRKQLRRAFLLIDAEHGIKASDQHMLDILHEAGTPHQIILSKSDKIIFPTSRIPSGERFQGLLDKLHSHTDLVREKALPKGKRGSAVLSDIICCSSEKSLDKGRMLGMDEVRWAVLQAAALDCDVNGKKKAVEHMNRIDDADIGQDGLVSWEVLGGATK